MDNKKQQGNRKQITFDLSQKALAEHYPRPKHTVNPRDYKKAYSDISRFMKKNGFEHRQFSVYTSIERLTAAKVSALIKKMAMEMPWLAHSVNQIDVTNIGSQHSLLQVMQIEQPMFKAQIIAEAEREAAELRAQKPEAPARGQHR